jgi:predicted membrane channel-forming protein YqfA (hemolysin III family)
MYISFHDFDAMRIIHMIGASMTQLVAATADEAMPKRTMVSSSLTPAVLGKVLRLAAARKWSVSSTINNVLDEAIEDNAPIAINEGYR